MNRRIVKCQKIVRTKNANQNFAKPKVTCSNVLSDQKSKGILFTILDDKEEQQTAISDTGTSLFVAFICQNIIKIAKLSQQLQILFFF